MWTSGIAVVAIVLILCAPVITSGQHDSNFSIPMLFPYGNCSTINYTETFTLFYTHTLEDKRLLYGYPILGPSHSKNEIFSSMLDTIHVFQLVQEDTDDNNIEDSLQWSYYCESAAIGYFTSVQSDPTVSLTVSIRRDNTVQLFSSLPFEPRVDTQEVNETTQVYEYYLLFGSFSWLSNDVFAVTVGSHLDYDPTNITIASSIDLVALKNSRDFVKIADEISLHIDEVLWVSSDCNITKGNLSGTWITATKPLGIFTANSQCNESFNYNSHLVHQMPPVHRWGRTYIVDLLATSLVQSANLTISFSMLAKNNTNVTFKWYEKQRPSTTEYITLQAEYPLIVTRDPTAFTHVLIQANDPILVIYEVCSTGAWGYFSILLQPVKWFSRQQSLVLTQLHLNHNLQQFFVSIAIETEYFDPHDIIVTDTSQPEVTATTLAQYKHFNSQNTDSVDEYTTFHLELNSDNLPEEEVLLLVNHTNPCAKLGATVYSYGTETSFAYSNGFILENSLSSGSSCTSSLASANSSRVYPITVGTSAGTLAFAVILAMIILIFRVKGRHKPVLPLHKEPDNNYEFDAFLSFADQDRKFVERNIYFPLTTRGYRIFWHYKHFIPGHTIDDNIIRGVQISRRVIFVCTIHFQRSYFCQKELKYAMASHYSERSRRIIPVVLQEEFCPSEFQQLNQVRFPRCYGNTERDLILKLELGQPVDIHKKQAR